MENVIDIYGIVILSIIGLLLNLLACSWIFGNFFDKDSAPKGLKIFMLIPPISILIGIFILLIIFFMFIKETISDLF